MWQWHPTTIKWQWAPHPASMAMGTPPSPYARALCLWRVAKSRFFCLGNLCRPWRPKMAWKKFRGSSVPLGNRKKSFVCSIRLTETQTFSGVCGVRSTAALSPENDFGLVFRPSSRWTKYPNGFRQSRRKQEGHNRVKTLPKRSRTRVLDRFDNVWTPSEAFCFLS